jgi:hypothetical protein
MVGSPDNPFSKLNEYELKHLAEHSISAGMVNGSKGLHSILAKETQQKRNAWYEAKEVVDNLEGFLNDISLAWEEADKEFQTEPALAIGRQCRYALITASIKSLTTYLPVELLIALIKNDNIWTPEKGLDYALQHPDPYLKVDSLTKLTNYLPLNLEELALSEALAAAREIQDERDRAKALSSLAPKLPPELLLDALAEAMEMQDEYWRAEALSSLAPKLPPELLPEVLAAAREIQDGKERVKVLRTLEKIRS